MKKPIISKYKINSLSTHRWSPRAFSERTVEREKLRRILAAARWAPSAFNEQPWRFIIGIKGDESYDKVLETLVEWNQKWASHAPVLILNVAKKTFSLNGKPNATFKYDLGQAVAHMSIEAMNQGVYSHQMSGFSPEKASKLFQLTEDYEPVSVTAFGYYGDPNLLPKDMYTSEIAKRSRKSSDEMFFTGNFGENTTLFKK
ncbi:MAG: nitroreductase family protein [Bacteroidetes bacterium]|nr:nitroreductase family protein [Bacteroidota bacterium]